MPILAFLLSALSSDFIHSPRPNPLRSHPQGHPIPHETPPSEAFKHAQHGGGHCCRPTGLGSGHPPSAATSLVISMIPACLIAGHASQELWAAGSHKVHPPGGPRHDPAGRVLHAGGRAAAAQQAPGRHGAGLREAKEVQHVEQCHGSCTLQFAVRNLVVCLACTVPFGGHFSTFRCSGSKPAVDGLLPLSQWITICAQSLPIVKRLPSPKSVTNAIKRGSQAM